MLKNTKKDKIVTLSFPKLWYRYNKILGRKKNNIVEPIHDKTTGEYIFEDNKISEKLTLHHIEKRRKNTYDAVFETNIHKELYDIIEQTTYSMENVYFAEADIEHAIKNANKNLALGPDRITVELIKNGGDLLIKSLTILMQACY